MGDVKKDNTVTVSEVGPGPFVQSVTVRGHKLLADEPLSFPGGTDKGLSPNDFLLSAVGYNQSVEKEIIQNLIFVSLKAFASTPLFSRYKSK